MRDRASRRADLRTVVESGACSGCGACSYAQGAGNDGLELNASGFLRPREEIVAQARIPNAACAGAFVQQPRRHACQDEDFGTYVGAWRAWAIDPETRKRGSSGGVLTAIAEWLLRTGQASSVVAAKAAAGTTSVGTVVADADEVAQTAGSRYAPCSSLANLDANDERQLLIARPCEVSAYRGLESAGMAPKLPLVFSFFCAGVPSQTATDELVRKLGVDASAASRVSYRGGGWPGRFSVVTSDGFEASCDYEESWGEHLGRDVMWRCKVCADAVGDSADVVVADPWHLGCDGLPDFSDHPGESALIARSPRGLAVIEAAAEAGVIGIAPVDLDMLRAVQVHQVVRRRSLPGRLLGARIARRGRPIFIGFEFWRSWVVHPLLNIRSAVGTIRRSRR